MCYYRYSKVAIAKKVGVVFTLNYITPSIEVSEKEKVYLNHRSLFPLVASERHGKKVGPVVDKIPNFEGIEGIESVGTHLRQTVMRTL